MQLLGKLPYTNTFQRPCFAYAKNIVFPNCCFWYQLGQDIVPDWVPERLLPWSRIICCPISPRYLDPLALRNESLWSPFFHRHTDRVFIWYYMLYNLLPCAKYCRASLELRRCLRIQETLEDQKWR